MTKEERDKIKSSCLKEMEKLSELEYNGHITIQEMNRQYKPLSQKVREILAVEEFENDTDIF